LPLVRTLLERLPTKWLLRRLVVQHEHAQMPKTPEDVPFMTVAQDVPGSGSGLSMFSSAAPKGTGTDWNENGGGGGGPTAQWMLFPNGYVAVFNANTLLVSGTAAPFQLMEKAFSDALP
jgi:hypothetical protein